MKKAYRELTRKAAVLEAAADRAEDLDVSFDFICKAIALREKALDLMVMEEFK